MANKKENCGCDHKKDEQSFTTGIAPTFEPTDMREKTFARIKEILKLTEKLNE